MIIALLILCVICVIQILKIIVKSSIANRNIIDYCLEYLVMLLVFIALFLQKDIPSNYMIIIASISIIYEVISSIYMYYNYIKKEKINNFSIKKVIDSSDVGILIVKGKKSILINNTMYNVLNKLDIKKDYIKNIISKSEEQLNENYVVKIEDQYYLFVINENEMIAFDITEEYNLQKEINEQNNKIAENNKELISSIKNIEELEKEKNLLKLKNKYHDILGQNLSVLQQYLNKQEVNKSSFEEMKFMIKKMFIDIEDTEDPNLNLKNLVEIHKKNGTNIIINGKLPENKEIANVFFEIIREATTNAIRHAGSLNVFVEITNNTSEINMMIKNDGKKPNEFITENEGIKGMRRKVDKINGLFYVSTVPEFAINVLIKK